MYNLLPQNIKQAKNKNLFTKKSKKWLIELDDVNFLLQIIFLKLSVEDVIKELNAIVTDSQENFNWQWMLTAVSVLVANSSRADLLKGIIDKWLLQACASKSAELLSVALLCARQCCAENPKKFSSYSSWFGNLQVRPADAFTFLFDFLSQLVPHEPVLCLKIHVNKEGRESDVTKVINNFNQTKEVMKVVLEASVFRRQFYEKVFLNELLKNYNPKHVEFIEKLYNMGKIPHGLYSRWLQLK